MSFHSHLTEFAGLPVLDAPADAPLPVPDGPVAWRVAHWAYDGGTDVGPSDEFAAAFVEFLDRVDPGQVTALVIGSWGYAAFNDAPIDTLCAAAGRLTGLRALFLGDITGDECEVSWIRQGDVTPLLSAYPNLEVLRVRGSQGLELTPLRHEHLRELAFETGGLGAHVVSGVLTSDLPALEHLELWLGVEDYNGDVEIDTLAPLLSGTLFPRLRRLGLRNAEIADEVAAAVGAAPLVARLEVLDLSMGMLTDDGAAELLSGQPLTHLRRLDLHYHFLSEAMAERLRAELPGVEVDLSEGQGEADRDEIYTAVSE